MRHFLKSLLVLLLVTSLSGCIALLPERAQKAASRTYPSALQGYAQATKQSPQQVQQNPLHQVLRIGASSSPIGACPVPSNRTEDSN